jgi:hypothetical protein
MEGLEHPIAILHACILDSKQTSNDIGRDGTRKKGLRGAKI